jgi:hypothetical protein
MWRVTRYSMVLWGYPPDAVEDILPRTVRLVDQTSGESLVWHLSSEPSRNLPKTSAEWKDLVGEHRERSSFDAVDMTLESTSGLVISLGVDAPTLVRDFDVLSVGLDTKHVEGPQALFSFERIYTLFTASLDVFQPFWARIYDKEQIITDTNSNLRLSIDLKKVPDTIHWFNYFDVETVERLGGKTNLLSAPAYLVVESENPPGIVLILQREPFDFHNPAHRQRQEEVVKYLQLERLYDLYPKKRDVQLAEHSPPD